MSFKRYCKKNGSSKIKNLINNSFPKEADWRELKRFVNGHDLPNNVATELEQLHDQYHMRFDGLKIWLHKIKKKMVG